jgi:hypothetical protein
MASARASCDALLLAAGELAGIALVQTRKLHQVEQLHHLGLDLVVVGAVLAFAHAQPEGHVLEHRHVLEQRVVLEHEAHAAFAHRQRRGVFPSEQDATAVGELQPCDRTQQRGLARARRTEQCDQLARLNVEIDAAEGLEAAEGLLDTANLDLHVNSGKARPQRTQRKTKKRAQRRENKSLRPFFSLCAFAVNGVYETKSVFASGRQLRPQPPLEKALEYEGDQRQQGQQRSHRERRGEVVFVVEDLDVQRHRVGHAANVA